MTRTGADAGRERQYTPTSDVDDVHGWYFYGITERGLLAPSFLASCGESPLELVELSGLAAVVRRVFLDDFRPAALRDRLHNDDGLETMVRSHNEVIEAIHARQTILPSKLGVVYAHADDLVSALRPVYETLVRKLDRLRSCDEWAIHLYADEAMVRAQVADSEPALKKLRDELAGARPGRAYFLGQQLRDELRAAAEQALLSHAQETFNRLSTFAVDALASPVKPTSDSTDLVEILRASFLISRDSAEQFKAEVPLCCDESEGVRCEYTGPWPPYSFAAHEEGEAV